MLEFDEFKQELDKYSGVMEELGEALNLATLRLRVDELDLKVSEPGFWDKPEESQKILQEAGNIKKKIKDYEDMATAYEDAQVMLEMAVEENEPGLIGDIREQIDRFIELKENLRISTLLSGEFDRNNAIVTLHPGAGGTEACDWTEMLFRMYTRWAEKRGYKVEILDYQDGDESGCKSVTMQINGENAYGYLRSEKGIHRLVRISPFDSSGRRHTSFSSCEVMPEIDDTVDVEINMDDLRIDTYRASGAGGQHVNKTSSAIRITHLPTGTVVQCQNERSQFQNKDRAMAMLRAKLYELEYEKRMAQMADIRGEVKENAWGSQIRSYVFHPYSLVKDYRSGEETANIQAVMDGGLDPFMNAYLAWANKK